MVTRDKAVSYAIINAGRFLGLMKHNVAVQVSQFKVVDKNFILPGATQEALKARPELREVTNGWSAKQSILGQPVYNEKDERIGWVDDIIVTPDKAVSYAIINAGGFLGLIKHNVAIPVSQFRFVDNKYVLPGATQDALKAMLSFSSAHSLSSGAEPGQSLQPVFWTSGSIRLPSRAARGHPPASQQ